MIVPTPREAPVQYPEPAPAGGFEQSLDEALGGAQQGTPPRQNDPVGDLLRDLLGESR